MKTTRTTLFKWLGGLLLVPILVFAQEAAVEQPLTRTTTGDISESTSTDRPELSDSRPQRFGYEMFQNREIMDSGLTGVHLPDEYQLGPGDRLGVVLGGKTNEQFEVTVGADGKVYVPTAGIFRVNGLSLTTFKTRLDTRLKRFYSDYQLELMLIAPKTIRLGVTGQVEAPGYYGLNALASVLDAILMAGGVSTKGSLRDIQLIRDGQIVARIDLYPFLLRPAAHHHQLLQSGDQIFVPVRQASVTLKGEIRQEAIYELVPERSETLNEFVAMAGGYTGQAYLEEVQIRRSLPNGERRVRFVNAQSQGDTLFLHNEDVVTVYSRQDLVQDDSVAIYGQVKRPGRYPFAHDLSLRDLILEAGYLTRKAYLLEAEVVKVDPLQPGQRQVVNLNQVLGNAKPENDIKLEPDDQVFIRAIPEWQVGPLVEIEGEVRFPGKYSIVRDSTRLSDVIRDAGGFTDQALVTEAKLIRQQTPAVEDKEYERLQTMTRDQMSDTEYEYFVMKQNTRNMREVVVNFDRLINHNDRSEDIFLKNKDRILVPTRPNLVMVSGRVSRPGGIIFQPGADFDYYIRKAGGFAWDADPDRTKVIKSSGETMDDEDVHSFSPGDRIWVPRKKDEGFWDRFQDVIATLSQIATVYLVIRTATER